LGTIAGSVVAGVAGLAIIIAVVFCILRKSRSGRQRYQMPAERAAKQNHEDPPSEISSRIINKAVGDHALEMDGNGRRERAFSGRRNMFRSR